MLNPRMADGAPCLHAHAALKAGASAAAASASKKDLEYSPGMSAEAVVAGIGRFGEPYHLPNDAPLFPSVLARPWSACWRAHTWAGASAS